MVLTDDEKVLVGRIDSMISAWEVQADAFRKVNWWYLSLAVDNLVRVAHRHRKDVLRVLDELKRKQKDEDGGMR